MSSLINLVAGLLFLFKPRLRCCCFPDSYLKILTTIFVALIKPWRESIDVRNMDQISISNLIMQFYILNFTKTSSVFQTVIGQRVIQSLISWEKSLKVVNNTFTIALWWRWIGKTLTQTSAYWISWQTWLIALHCSHKTFCFLCASNGPTSISSNISLTLRKSHETIIAWKVSVFGVIMFRIFRHLAKRTERLFHRGPLNNCFRGYFDKIA